MNSYSNAGRGLGTVFTAQILAIVAAVLMVAGVLLVPLILVAAVLGLVALVMNIVGLNTASHDHPGYKSAMGMVIAGILLEFLSNLTSGVALLSALLGVVGMAASYLMVAYVCNATAELLDQKGDGFVAAKGAKIKRMYLGCTVVGIVCSLLAVIPIINIIAGIAAFITAIVQLVAYILYLSFLSSAKNSLLV